MRSRCNSCFRPAGVAVAGVLTRRMSAVVNYRDDVHGALRPESDSDCGSAPAQVPMVGIDDRRTVRRNPIAS